jgi:hypothetical protein
VGVGLLKVQFFHPKIFFVDQENSIKFMREEFADISKEFAKSTKGPFPFPSYWFDLSYELRTPSAWMVG